MARDRASLARSQPGASGVNAGGGGGRGVPGDLRDRLVQERPGDGEVLGDQVGELAGLAPVDHEQRGQRDEQGEPQAGEAVAVHVGAAPVGRGEERGVGEGLPAAVGRGCGRLEVDQRDRVVRAHHHVEHVQVVEDHAALVESGDDAFHPLVDAQRPLGVFRGLRGIRLGIEHRVPFGEERVERPSLDELLDQEMVLAEREPVEDGGHSLDSVELFQNVVLAPETGHRVRAVGGEARMGAPFFQDHLRAAPGVGRRVDPAPVGEMEGFVDPVGQIGRRRGAACPQMRFQAGGKAHPFGDGEDGIAPVRNQFPGAVAQRGDEPALLVQAPALRESAVPDVQRPLADAQVAEDVRAGKAVQQGAEPGEHLGQFVLVRGVDRDELPARPARRVLGVAPPERSRAAQVLELDSPGRAVLPGSGERLLRAFRTSGDVHLPALFGGALDRRNVDDPFVSEDLFPALREFSPRDVEIGAAGHRRSIVEELVCEAVKLVPLVHGRFPLPRAPVVGTHKGRIAVMSEMD